MKKILQLILLIAILSWTIHISYWESETEYIWWDKPIISKVYNQSEKKMVFLIQFKTQGISEQDYKYDFQITSQEREKRCTWEFNYKANSVYALCWILVNKQESTQKKYSLYFEVRKKSTNKKQAEIYRNINLLKNISSFDWVLDIKDWKIIKPKTQVIDIDVLDSEKKLVTRLKKEWKIVIWYINVWSIENYRDDYKLFPKEVVWKTYPNWEDEKFLDIKNYEKFQHLIINRLDIAQQKWFDGIEPDNMDIYDNFEETWFKITKWDMKEYLVWLQKEVHKRGMFLIQKNAPELSKSMSQYFDWALLEWAFYNNFSQNFTSYISAKKVVFNTEYTDNTSKKEFLENVCPKSKKLWFISILKHRNLDNFVVECSPAKPSPQPSPLKEREKQSETTAIETQLTLKLDKIFGKLDTKYSLEKRKRLVTKVLHKLQILKTKKLSHTKKYLLEIIEKRFLVQQHIYASKKLLPTKNKIYFGAFQEFGWGETEVDSNKLNNFNKLVSKKPAWAYFSQDFAEEWIVFPKESIETIIKSWEIPFIRLMPSMVYEKNKQTYNLKDIASWKFDDGLKKWAQNAKKINSPLLIDFAVESNGDWFFYSGTPELYKKAYRHIIEIFRKQGVKNVTWFFHPNLQSVPDKAWNKPKYYYPWDEYIDWIWISLYWTQNPKEENIDFEEVLEEFHTDILKISKNKPFILLEFWVADFNPHYKKEKWLEDTFTLILSNPYIKFSAISAWSEKWEEKNYYSDLRINSSQKSLDVYNKYLRKDIFSNKLKFSNETKKW